MLMRFFSLFFIVLLASSCAKAPAHLPPVAIKAVQNRQVPSFNQVLVEGRINVNLHTGYARPQVILYGNPSDLIHVSTRVVNGMLIINLGSGYPRCGAVRAEIRGRYLNSFTYRGAGTITGTNLRSGLLDLAIDNPGRTTLGGSIVLRKVKISGGGNVQLSGVNGKYLQLTLLGKTRLQLAGMLNLAKLDLAGQSWVSMYWIKSDTLTIRARGKTFIQLAGIVNKLDVELWDTAHFNGRYLRSKRTFAKTHDKSVADIIAVKHQHTFATDASDIYFYNIPDTKADFMVFDGSVLDMRDWDQYAMRDYDRYNK